MKSVYLVVMIVVVVLGQQKTATEGAFCSTHVPTSNSKIQAWVCFHVLERCHFPDFDRIDI